MKTKILLTVYFSIFLFVIKGISQDYPIYCGKTFNRGIDMGVNTGMGRTNWVEDSLGYMKIKYPCCQPTGRDWGAVFLTIGKPTDQQRPYQNFSAYKTLSVEMKGKYGGENVEIGIKDNTDRDDGQEAKIQTQLTKNWKVYEFPLEKFTSADLSHLYVVIEFVFSGTKEVNMYFKNAKYKK